MARVTPLHSGVHLLGVVARSTRKRVAAQMAVADLRLASFLIDALESYKLDVVTRPIMGENDAAAFEPVVQLALGGLRNWLLGDAADAEALAVLVPGLAPEMVAAISKIARGSRLPRRAQAHRRHPRRPARREAGAVSSIDTAHQVPMVMELARWSTIDASDCALTDATSLIRSWDFIVLPNTFLAMGVRFGEVGMIVFVPAAAIHLVAVVAGRATYRARLAWQLDRAIGLEAWRVRPTKSTRH